MQMIRKYCFHSFTLRSVREMFQLEAGVRERDRSVNDYFPRRVLGLITSCLHTTMLAGEETKGQWFREGRGAG